MIFLPPSILPSLKPSRFNATGGSEDKSLFLPEKQLAVAGLLVTGSVDSTFPNVYAGCHPVTDSRTLFVFVSLSRGQEEILTSIDSVSVRMPTGRYQREIFLPGANPLSFKGFDGTRRGKSFSSHFPAVLLLLEINNLGGIEEKGPIFVIRKHKEVTVITAQTGHLDLKR